QFCEERRDLAVLQRTHEFALKRGLQVFEDLQGTLLRQEAIDNGTLSRAEPLEHLEKLSARQLAGSHGQASQVPVAERLLDGLNRRSGRVCWLFDHRNHSLSGESAP